jgi:hypothetical protein
MIFEYLCFSLTALPPPPLAAFGNMGIGNALFMQRNFEWKMENEKWENE